MKILFIAALLPLVAACAGFETIAPQLATKGATAADNALTAAEWAICNAATVGSVRRRYGKSAESAEAWNNLCATDKGLIVRAE